MIAFARPFRAVPLARLLALLPCGRCGSPGPHTPIQAPGGGNLALCQRCQTEVIQDAAENDADSLHLVPLAAGDR